MSYTIDKKDIFPFDKNDLKSFSVYIYEWVDNLHFTLSPQTCIDNFSDYEEIVKKIFLDAGWYGDGEIKFMWLPPFSLPDSVRRDHNGIVIFFVKQKEDGLSFLLSPIPLNFFDPFRTGKRIEK